MELPPPTLLLFVSTTTLILSVFDDGPVDASGSACFDEPPNSIFADAPDDYVDEENGGFEPSVGSRGEVRGAAPLAENVRKEILELGFPDDGYNYLRTQIVMLISQELVWLLDDQFDTVSFNSYAFIPILYISDTHTFVFIIDCSY